METELYLGVGFFAGFIYLAILIVEIFFIIWTIRGIKESKKTTQEFEVIKNKCEIMYNERTEDFQQMEQLKRRIEELEKIIEKGNINKRN